VSAGTAEAQDGTVVICPYRRDQSALAVNKHAETGVRIEIEEMRVSLDKAVRGLGAGPFTFARLGLVLAALRPPALSFRCWFTFSRTSGRGFGSRRGGASGCSRSFGNDKFGSYSWGWTLGRCSVR
jgi:hypothetical protein